MAPAGSSPLNSSITGASAAFQPAGRGMVTVAGLLRMVPSGSNRTPATQLPSAAGIRTETRVTVVSCGSAPAGMFAVTPPSVARTAPCEATTATLTPPGRSAGPPVVGAGSLGEGDLLQAERNINDANSVACTAPMGPP